MRVLDVGTGAGDVALVAADLVGPSGAVVGIDVDADLLEVARGRAVTAGWTNVSFLEADAHRFGPYGDFDAVVGRWILMYQPHPAALLRSAAGQVRPGGIIAFQEGDFDHQPTTFPAVPLHERVRQWMTPPPGTPGPDLRMGSRLYTTYLDAALPPPQLHLEAPIGGGAAWPGFTYLADTVRSLLPFIEQLGLVTAEEVEVDTLSDRLRAEVVEECGVQILPPLIGAWTRAAP